NTLFQRDMANNTLLNGDALQKLDRVDFSSLRWTPTVKKCPTIPGIPGLGLAPVRWTVKRLAIEQRIRHLARTSVRSSSAIHNQGQSGVGVGLYHPSMNSNILRFASGCARKSLALERGKE